MSIDDNSSSSSVSVPMMVSPTEKTVTQIWREILQQPGLEPSDNFFALGGDSLAMMMILYRVSEELCVQLPQAALLESPTLKQFCQVIDKEMRAVRQSADPAAQDPAAAVAG